MEVYQSTFRKNHLLLFICHGFLISDPFIPLISKLSISFDDFSCVYY